MHKGTGYSALLVILAFIWGMLHMMPFTTSEAEEPPDDDPVDMCICDVTGQYTYLAHVKSVYDGDTVTVDVYLGLDVVMVDQKIRLYGIDAPEVRGEEREAGLKSRDWLRERILMQDVVLETPEDKKGKYGRWLGTLYMGGVNINEQLVSLGLAEEADY